MSYRDRSFWRSFFPSLLIMLVLLPLSAVQSQDSAAEPAAAPAQSVAPADWPLPRYGSGRSNYNAGEQELQPPLVQNIPASFNFVDPDAIISDSLLVVGDTAYLSMDEDESYTVRAVDLGNVRDNTARELWRYGGGESIDQPLRDLAISGDILLVKQLKSFLEGAVVALDRGSGAVRWRRAYRSDFVSGGNLILAYNVDGARTFMVEQVGAQYSLVALDTTSGQELWRQNLPDGSYPQISNGVVATSGRVFVVFQGYEEGAQAWAYDQASGAQLWRSALPTDFESTFHFNIVATDAVAAVQYNDGFVALDAATGAERWKLTWNCDADKVGSPDMGTDGERLIAAWECTTETDVEGNMQVLDLESGAEQWSKTGNAFNRTFARMSKYFVVANDLLFVVENIGTFIEPKPAIVVYRVADGEPVETVESEDFPTIRDIAIANGRLYLSGGFSSFTRAYGVIFVFEQADDRYLDSYDEDGLAFTNPMGGTPVPLIRRNDEYMARVGIGVEEMTQTVTLRVYASDDTVYKEAEGTPDRFGNAFWEVPLAYTANGYSYDVELPGGTTLPRRRIDMPADPEAGVRTIQNLDGLQWVSPPGTIGSVPATLRLLLPDDFPEGQTGATLVLRSQGQGGNFIPGQRVGDAIEFVLTKNNVVRGTFQAQAVAEAGSYTAFSPEHTLRLDAAGLPDVMPGYVFGMQQNSDGSVEGVGYRFEREHDDEATQVDAQVADIMPGPGGVRVTLRVNTPDEDPDDPRTKRRRVRVTGSDESGRPVASSPVNVPGGSRGLLIPVNLPQRGAQPIRNVKVEAEELLPPEEPPDPSPTPQPPEPPPPPPACDPPPPPESSPTPEPDEPPKSAREWLSSDRFHITTDSGVSGSAAYYLGVGGAAYNQVDHVQGTVQNCVEYGGRLGAGIGAGPTAAVGGAYDLPGPGSDAPATSGRKIDLTAEVIGGVQLSFTIPDNWETADSLGTLGVGFIAETEVGVSGGISKVQCDPMDDQPQDNNRRGGNGPDCPPLPPPPGGDHPDDTLSVVLTNLTPQERIQEWENLARNARFYGFGELATYADYRARSEAYYAQINQFPVRTPLSQEQRTILGDSLAYRLIEAEEQNRMLPLVLEQWRLLEAQGSAHVLASGYYAATLSMLSDYGIPARTVPAGFSPQALGSSLLVIPTGGLAGVRDIQGFTDRLDEFVLNGGTLLVMSQPEDETLDALPGDGLEQVGYNNDISCFRDAMTMLTYHPMLASRTTPRMTSHVDGYLTDLPATATMLMERTKNNQGALAIYPFGDGRVIVTNMYDDWGRTVGQSSPAVRDLFHDVARWGMQPGDLPDTQPEGSVQVRLDVVNQSSSEAASVAYIARDPSGAPVPLQPTSEEQTIAPGETTTLNPTFESVSGQAGIWQVNYELLNTDGDVIQPETTGSLFTLSDPPVLFAAAARAEPAQTVTDTTSITPTVLVDVALDQAAYRPGDTVQVTLDISVDEPGAVEELEINVSLGAETQQQIITAQANQQATFELPADFSGDGLLFYGVYDVVTAQGLYLNTRWVQQAGESLVVTTDKPRYTPGETVELSIESDSAGTVTLQGPRLNQRVRVEAGTTSESFMLPQPMASGGYVVQAEGSGESLLVRFDVKGPAITIRTLQTPQSQIEAGSPLSITTQVESDAAVDTYLVGTLVEPDGNPVRVLAQRQALLTGTQTISASVPFSTTVSGMSRFDLQIVDVNDPGVVYAQTTRSFNTGTPELTALRVSTPRARPTRMIDLELDWYSPAERTVAVTFFANGSEIATREVTVEQGFTTVPVSLIIPTGGGVDLAAVATVDGLQTRASATLMVKRAIYLPLTIR